MSGCIGACCEDSDDERSDKALRGKSMLASFLYMISNGGCQRLTNMPFLIVNCDLVRSF